MMHICSDGTQALQSLVDYDEDSDDEQQTEEEKDSTSMSPAKRLKLETS